MFSHIMLGANDVQASKAFYDATFKTLGYGEGFVDPKGRCFYRTDTGTFAITKPINGDAATHGNGSTIGFAATSEEAVNAWHAAGVANGGISCEDAPGIRALGKTQLYLAYLRDPSGNKLCAMYRL
ncbi:VOC family protein [Marinomonas shanghaiensis]|jgi:catechol 2,3-dioxygenase-like lactoylglutathione lyase family enzyme|uniref:VOC family protein n=1 Tax=Marinomonas shanghaiensis TaxID=2202418 RepID=UPI000DB97595|nr:VOC family protein [Marinomonas shanghaiensis]